MSSNTITYYSRRATALSEQYESLSFTDVHGDWIQHLPTSGWALDVGAGSGRDNASKSDRLPSAEKLSKSRESILHWWQLAWGNSHTEFFTQARLALPHVSKQSQDFEEVFAAFALQRNRIRELQQLAEWP